MVESFYDTTCISARIIGGLGEAHPLSSAADPLRFVRKMGLTGPMRKGKEGGGKWKGEGQKLRGRKWKRSKGGRGGEVER